MWIPEQTAVDEIEQLKVAIHAALDRRHDGGPRALLLPGARLQALPRVQQHGK